MNSSSKRANIVSRDQEIANLMDENKEIVYDQDKALFNDIDTNLASGSFYHNSLVSIAPLFHL